MKFRALFGPSTLVTAAFIGPGTITTCTLAGINHGYELLWALAFAALATIVLQEMAARLGWVSGRGLGEAIREQFQGPFSKPLSFALVISAILIGNATFEAGNLSGAAIGLELLFGGRWYWALVVGGMSFALLSFGKYQWIERILIALVIMMSLCFLITAFLVHPDFSKVLRGFRPRAITSENFLLIMGIIGTTVVPYNLFLHASTISRKWKKDASIWELRLETTVAIFLGVFISMLIIVTSATTRDRLNDIETVETAKSFAIQLQPLAGDLAYVLMGIGFFAAGISSALTAPLAAAYAIRGLFDWPANDRHKQFMAIWMTILGIGFVISLTQLNLIYIIKFAQAANAVVLPLIGVFLLYLSNRSEIMGKYKNGVLSNVLGSFVLIVLLALSFSSLVKVYHYFV